MNKKIINIYIAYMVKKPILFIAMISVGVFFILYLTLIIKTDVIHTFDGTINQATVLIPVELKNVPKTIYFYKDRNEAVYPAEVMHIENKGNSTALSIATDNIPFTDLAHLKVDVPIKQMTLFERVFLKGGKVNNE